MSDANQKSQADRKAREKSAAVGFVFVGVAMSIAGVWFIWGFGAALACAGILITAIGLAAVAAGAGR